MNNWVINAQSVTKSFIDGDKVITVLKGLDLQVAKGESIAIVGQSGSGKSTLLQLLAGLDQFDAGEIWIGGIQWQGLSTKESAQLRNQKLGFVFQFHHLLAEFSAAENVAIPAIMAGLKPRIAMERAEALLSKVGLDQRKDHRPSALSGGERQRVAVARALVNQPACVLMDEPTGNLDQTSAEQVFLLLKTLQTELDTAFVVVTHDQRLAAQQDRQLQLANGTLLLKLFEAWT